MQLADRAHSAHRNGRELFVGFLSRLFGRGRADEEDGGEDVVIQLDQELRKQQLVRLEQALDQLATQMRACDSLDNPGWRIRVNEYARLAGEAMVIRRGEVTREAVLDLVFAVRPVFSNEPPPGKEQLVPLQDAVLSAAEDLRALTPSERPGS